MNPDQDSDKSTGLAWPKLIPGTLVKRYKRFLADIKLENGEIVTAHCPNSGAMKTCCEPGSTVYISYHDNPKRKLKYTWEIIKMPTSLVGVNTQVPNRLVFEAIKNNMVEELCGYTEFYREVKTSDHSRLDILLTKDERNKCYVEVKNCTLVEDTVARFPDAVTKRGLKHLVELQKLVSEGYRGIIFFLVQRMDAKIFKPADTIDPAYGRELRRAVANGVEILVYDVHMDLQKIVLNKKVPYFL